MPVLRGRSDIKTARSRAMNNKLHFWHNYSCAAWVRDVTLDVWCQIAEIASVQAPRPLRYHPPRDENLNDRNLPIITFQATVFSLLRNFGISGYYSKFK